MYYSLNNSIILGISAHFIFKREYRRYFEKLYLYLYILYDMNIFQKRFFLFIFGCIMSRLLFVYVVFGIGILSAKVAIIRFIG